MSSAESGRTGAIAVSGRQGYLAYFEKVNRQRGVLGRKVKLIDYDDHYQALNTVANTERLINLDKVLALVGYVGTSTSAAILSMIEGAQIVFFAPVSGALRL